MTPPPTESDLPASLLLHLQASGSSASDAPLLFCLHGIGSNADAFIPQNPLAEKLGMRLLAWDAPGYRNSPDPSQAPGIDGWADAAAEVITQESETKTATVLGVSWGGVIATRLCLRRPELVSALILADSSCGAGGRPETAEAMRSRAAGLTELGPAEFASTRANVLVSDSASPQLRGHIAQMMVESLRMPSYQWACDSMADTYHAPDLGQIQVPTLVLVGQHDQVTPLNASKKLADGIANAKLQVIPGAGHLANQEVPVAFNEAVAEFLQAL